jgi:hypothetical protein
MRIARTRFSGRLGHEKATFEQAEEAGGPSGPLWRVARADPRPSSSFFVASASSRRSTRGIVESSRSLEEHDSSAGRKSRFSVRRWGAHSGDSLMRSAGGRGARRASRRRAAPDPGPATSSALRGGGHRRQLRPFDGSGRACITPSPHSSVGPARSVVLAACKGGPRVRAGAREDRAARRSEVSEEGPIRPAAGPAGPGGRVVLRGRAP